jgi:5-methylcytosine-specific restriction endonuclease McrA
MIDAEVRRFVRLRAGDACEYCGLRQDQSPLASLHVDHVRPRKHHGGDDPENLALACIDCNLARGSNISGFDPNTQQLTPLFNPRSESWDEHFEWRGAYVVGKTAIGRTTVDVLRMNSEEQVQLRLALKRS